MKWNSEKWLSISAISISFLTLVIFVYQTNLLSKQNYLSILPYLALSKTENKGDHIFALNLENHGVGPAIIESVSLKYKNSRYDLTKYDNVIYTFFRALEPALDSIEDVSYSTIDPGLALPANSKYNLLTVKNSKEDYDLMVQSLNRLLDKGLEYEIIYKSIQNERWRIHANSQEPELLD